MRRICLSIIIIIILCIVSKAYTKDVQQSNDLVRNPSNQMSDHPEEQEVSPQVGDSFSAKDIPSSKETELGRRQPSGEDPLSENQDSRIPRRVRKSAEPSINRDRIRWLLLVSPLLIVLLSLITCALGKKALWKPGEDTQKIVLSPPQISFMVQPGHGGEVPRGGEGRRNMKTSSRGAKPGGDHDSYSEGRGHCKTSSGGLKPGGGHDSYPGKTATRTIPTDVEDMQPGPAPSSRTSRRDFPSPSGIRGTNQKEGRHSSAKAPAKISNHLETNQRKGSSMGSKSRVDSYTEKHGKKFQEAGIRPTARNAICSVTQSYSNMDGGNFRRAISVKGDTAIRSWSDGGSLTVPTVSAGGDPDNGYYLENELTTENRMKTSSKGKDRVKQEKTSSEGEGQAKREKTSSEGEGQAKREKTSSEGEGQAKREKTSSEGKGQAKPEKTSSEGEGQEEQVKVSSEGEDRFRREIPSPEGENQAKRERTSSESENQVKRKKISSGDKDEEKQEKTSSEVEVQAKQKTSSEDVEDMQPGPAPSLRTSRSDFPSPSELLQRTFLQKLMALDISARNTVDDEEILLDSEEEEYGDMKSSECFNPLDVLCGLLHQSDMILKQQIVSKMSMCQFAVPLLLPSPNTQDCTFMLWSMRDIVKKWRPHSMTASKTYVEDSIVNVPMPMFSFVRLGTCSISKSRYLNQVLSPSQQNHNFFVHGDMPGGNIPRKHSDGLVEIIWYLPSGHEQLDVFPEPIAVMNLRGDLESNEKQLNFLTRVSSALFIFIEEVQENQHNLLSRLRNVTNVFLILNVRDREDNMKDLKTLNDTLQLPRQNILVKTKHINDSQVVKKIRSAMKMIFTEIKETFNLEQISKKATEFSIDENSPECKETKAKAKEITDEINNINHYKHETMKLQGDLWKEISKMEKEICRMRKLGDEDAEEYKSGLQAKILTLQMVQRQHHLTGGMLRYQEALMLTDRTLFLKWLKILLDKIGKNHLRELHNEYKFKYQRRSTTEQDLQIIDQKIVDGSLGVEHFIRELGQYYEAKCSMIKQGFIPEDKMQFAGLPGIASDLLLDGFPFELIDGDASNIPLEWITDVLTELDKKTGGQCRMRVITVLGVQSTGKSTLLNTMFGLQFPVASGRCTRGAFMTLIKAKENFQEELNCDFILVIDTEGLKSLDLASLENSYEHDNELATVVVGLSDITIVNMAMENAEEMKDILQIVVHAFLRMKGIGKKSSCKFVHQNVSDVSAHVKNRNARQKFLLQLSEMAKVAAKMEKRSGINNFSDIIYCDIEKDSWYIPGLWYGIPPMASVNSGYSETVSELKQSIIGSLQSMDGKPQNIREFTEWIKSLWNAVKHEKFVFSFRNRLVTEAYNQLCIYYADWEWTFQKHIHRWMMETETFIYNLPYEKLGADVWSKLLNDINQILDKEETAMHQCLEEYFESDFENAHLLEMFRGDFFRSVKYLRKELENVLRDKCEKTIRIQKEKSQIQAMQAQYINIMEEKVAEMMGRRRNEKYMGNSKALQEEFEEMWVKTVSTLRLSKLEVHDVGRKIFQQLKRDIGCEDDVIRNRLRNLDQYKDIVLEDKHLSSYSLEHFTLVNALIEKCSKYVEDIMSNKEDFNELYSQDLLSLINKRLRMRDFQDLHITKCFEFDLKLYILKSATIKFQQIHEDFVQRNDPRTCLEMLKPQYYSTFKNMYEKRDECRRKAEQFCQLCLKPAITDHINKYLGKEMMDDILQVGGPEEFKSRKRLQLVILEKLLEDKSCYQYDEYISDYEHFLKRWISSYIAEHYKDQGPIRAMQLKTLNSLMAKVQQTFNYSTLISSASLTEFLVHFCNIFEKELVISKNDMKAVLFQSNLNVKQFAKDVKLYLHHLQDEIQKEFNTKGIETTFSQLTLKPQEELFRKVIGCGKKCPFCKAPCEAGGADHKEHFASLHRPRGLGRHENEQTKDLDHSICSTNVISNKTFKNEDTGWKPHPYKDYRTYYPDWAIYPDMTANSSNYWKFVLKEFNDSFAQIYRKKTAKIPEDWCKISYREALTSLRTTLQ
ncbi:interferon-induced very large GTPase 1-like isoform X3 [Bufo gargarizans]|uniref:interferon-induced very large GTPase 1-like isoform X3 n=1 Tax=Bufo gargarizans TaxID=30331 RepID=UPI001CF12DF4|nr:interferon-induced very large GTPase 1-like isoform X3 [Bufo gargarizans]